MNPPIRLAIVGSGVIARTHAEAIRLLPGARLTAICSRNLEKARELAAGDGIRICGSLPEMLEGDNVDAVLIATPSGSHEEAAVPALRAGKHVLCEKPLEISTERVARMINAAEENGRILAGFFQRRNGPGAQSIRAALDENRFGRLTFLSVRVKWWRSQEYYSGSSWRGTWALDGGGALMNQGIHAVDLAQWLGGPVTEVLAFSGTLTHPGLEVEDTLAASLRFESGALGTIEASTSCYPGLEFSLEISGDSGTAVLVNDRIEHWRFADERLADESIRQGTADGKNHGGASNSAEISCGGHRQQIAEFCRAIRGEKANLVDAREAGKAVAIVEAIYRSARSGKSAPVPR